MKTNHSWYKNCTSIKKSKNKSDANEHSHFRTEFVFLLWNVSFFGLKKRVSFQESNGMIQKPHLLRDSVHELLKHVQIKKKVNLKPRSLWIEANYRRVILFLGSFFVVVRHRLFFALDNTKCFNGLIEKLIWITRNM